MNIMKIIGCIMVVASSAGVGFYLSSEMKGRIEDLKELYKLVSLLKGDIRYASTPLPEAIQSISRRHQGRFFAFFNNISLQLEERPGQTFAEIWRSAVSCGLVNTSLSKKDKSHLIQFGDTIGYLDKDMQMNTLDLYLSQLDYEITDLSKTVKEKSYLYRTLGITSGIFIIILMV